MTEAQPPAGPPERPRTDAERRDMAAALMGYELDDAFARNPAQVRDRGAGWRELNLTLPADDRQPHFSIVEYTHPPTGERTAFLTFNTPATRNQHPVSTRLVYRNVPGFAPSIQAAPAEGELDIRRTLPANHFANNNRGVRAWGEAWIDAMQHGQAIDQTWAERHAMQAEVDTLARQREQTQGWALTRSRGGLPPLWKALLRKELLTDEDMRRRRDYLDGPGSSSDKQ